jgi:hypothetical protein
MGRGVSLDLDFWTGEPCESHECLGGAGKARRWWAFMDASFFGIFCFDTQGNVDGWGGMRFWLCDTFSRDGRKCRFRSRGITDWNGNKMDATNCFIIVVHSLGVFYIE